MPDEEITKNNQNKWSVVFAVFYVSIFAGGLAALKGVNGELPNSIPLFDFVLIVLASFRLTRLFVYDIIMQFFETYFSIAKSILMSVVRLRYADSHPRKAPEGP